MLVQFTNPLNIYAINNHLNIYYWINNALILKLKNRKFSETLCKRFRELFSAVSFPLRSDVTALWGISVHLRSHARDYITAFVCTILSLILLCRLIVNLFMIVLENVE